MGVIYVLGNLTLAVKSLVRRHFLYTQIGVLRGDNEWLRHQKYTRDGNTVPLFLSKPKDERRFDAEMLSFNSSANLNAVRLQV